MQMHVTMQHLLNIDHTMCEQDPILLLVLFGFLQRQIRCSHAPNKHMACNCTFVRVHQCYALCKQLQSADAMFQSALLAFS